MDLLPPTPIITVLINPRFTPKQLPSIPVELTYKPSSLLLSSFGGDFQREIVADFADFKVDYAKFQQRRLEILAEIEKNRLRSIAPGLSRNPLVPQPSSSSNIISTQSPVVGGLKRNAVGSSEVGSGDEGALNLSDFENGLPPLNPWDLPGDDFEQLKTVFPQQSHQQPQQNTQSSCIGGDSDALLPPAYSLLASDTKPQLPIRPPVPPSTSTTSTTSMNWAKLPTSLTTPLATISTSKPVSKPKTTLDPRIQRVVDLGFDVELAKLGMLLYTSINPTPSSSTSPTNIETSTSKVTNYCLVIELLEKRGYSRVDIVDAIEMYGREDPDSPKVSAYLEAYSRVKEMGFERVQIREALIKSEPKDGRFDRWSEDATGALLN